jgi:RNA polymerase sigma-70 factor (ECF subfamily)
MRALEEAPGDNPEATVEFDEALRRQIVIRAADVIRADLDDSTWEAFRLTAIEGLSASEAAERTKLSLGAVYVAKCRALKRLRAVARRLADEAGISPEDES